MRGKSRTVKPEIFSDEVLSDLERDTGLPVFRGFVGLWCFADREGRFEWSPRALRGLILPCWEGDFGELLTALQGAGYVVRYESGGKVYGHIPDWCALQSVHPKEAPSALPAPPVGLRVIPGNPSDASLIENCSQQERSTPVEVKVEVEEELKEEVGERVGRQGRVKFRPDWKPTRALVEYGRSIGLSDDEMRERAEHCRLKLYSHPFASEAEQFKRELLWLRKDKETAAFAAQRKANPSGREEYPGRDRQPDDPHPLTVFGRIAGGG